MAKILVMHGPNLNLLGDREPEIYGTDSLRDINERCQTLCANNGHEFSALQSNAELISLIEYMKLVSTEHPL